MASTKMLSTTEAMARVIAIGADLSTQKTSRDGYALFLGTQQRWIVVQPADANGMHRVTEGRGACAC